MAEVEGARNGTQLNSVEFNWKFTFPTRPLLICEGVLSRPVTPCSSAKKPMVRFPAKCRAPHRLVPRVNGKRERTSYEIRLNEGEICF